MSAPRPATGTRAERSSRSARARALVVCRRVAMVALLVAILFRPGIGQADAPTTVADVEVLVVLDRTKSMDAADFDGDQRRLVGARRDLKELTADLPGARFAMLTFGKTARLELPFTTDTTAFGSLVETVRTEAPYNGVGSLVDRPLPEMVEILQRAAEENPDRRRLVVFVSDGENTADAAQQSFAEVGDLVAGGAVLGYGTTEGGTMATDPDDEDSSYGQEPIYDAETGDDAVSRLDPDNLQTIADQLGVTYVQRDAPDDGEAMASLAESFEAKPTPDPEAVAGLPADHELTWILALVLLGLAVLELRGSWRGLLGARRAGAGS